MNGEQQVVFHNELPGEAVVPRTKSWFLGEVAETIQSRPRTWAVVNEYDDHSVANGTLTGLKQAHTKNGFEFVLRAVNGRLSLLAKYTRARDQRTN